MVLLQINSRNSRNFNSQPLLIHIRTLQTRNSIFINVTSKQNTIKIGSQYSKPSGNLEEDLKDWTNAIRNSTDFILGEDSNAHIQALGYYRNNSRGEILLEYISMNRLTIVKDPNSDYAFEMDTRSGKPDITLWGTST